MADVPDGGFRIGGVLISDFEDVFCSEFTPGVAPISTSDMENPVHDETFMGRDLLRGPSWTFRFVIDKRTEAEALEVLSRLTAAWRDRSRRIKGGETVALDYGMAGRTRTVYGRPRRFAPVLDSRGQGIIEIDADFQLADPLHYDEQWSEVVLDMVPPMTRGLIESLHEPLSTVQGGRRQGIVDYFGGDAETPMLIEVSGHIRNPYVSWDNNVYQFDIEVPRNQKLVIDTRLGTARLGSRSVASSLKGRTRLRSVHVPQGQSEITFGGISDDMAAQARFAWRPAYYGI